MATQSQVYVGHAAIAATHQLPLDTYLGLFDNIFNSEDFIHWRSDGRSWQLHYIGGPGSGKTTLSAIAAQYLRDMNGSRNVGVATIFIQKDVAFRDQTFIQAFLESLYHQLSYERDDGGLATGAFLSYKQALDVKPARSMAHRLKLLRKAVYPLIMSLQRAFLVVDGIDRCHQSVTDQLEAELSRLQHYGLSIMTTSRFPQYRSGQAMYCDAPDHDLHSPPDVPVTVFWGCKWCWASSKYTICQQCKENGDLCNNCLDGGLLFEPSERLEIDFAVSDRSMRSFVSWDLEREHGDINLKSANDRKPPLSALGRSLRDKPNATEELIEKIVERASGNITIAKLDLDSLANVQSVEAAISSFAGDRLSNNILALFDDVLERIKHLTEHERHITLASILSAVHEDHGARFQDIEKWIRESRLESDAQGHARLTVEEILRAARGFLGLSNCKDQLIYPYHEMLKLYADEHYDEALFWEHAHMRFGRMKRSETVDPSAPGRFGSNAPRQMKAWGGSRGAIRGALKSGDANIPAWSAERTVAWQEGVRNALVQDLQVKRRPQGVPKDIRNLRRQPTMW
ncbi:hypothetical protein EJ05DRAFT_473619 [Pseudovirgaria hyperparasitica]|uniref:Nephrocystin 3-like N-terminal domain-containing protein n=1 Tax=Pseudovirgaria hyperparasitica TaxID=470096 RepID=A0A6A6WHD0_9PEZI|nr:uncharacterized protein EJ05DRAFT_473619 [Pseudovirgaria hyperparasitica]KAF2761057.1 hypothetical protein EJ05DRAFT_473619 [Pseudovirgaria hyperparasitica]